MGDIEEWDCQEGEKDQLIYNFKWNIKWSFFIEVEILEEDDDSRREIFEKCLGNLLEW